MSSSTDSDYTISARDLLQANATVVAGVFILLTITTSSDRPFTLLNMIIRGAGMVPFVMSCRFLLKEFSTKEYGYRMAKHLTYYGLLGLILVIILFLALSQYGGKIKIT